MTDFWTDASSVTEWERQDAQQDLLAVPRRIAAEIVAIDRPSTARILDVGSGPGDFLACLLERFPSATGIWNDISEAMESIARAKMARFGDRVDYRLGDMADLSGLPDGLDVVVTSRAVHHLDVAGLHRFYAEAATHLAPGGWLINLDHTGPADDLWDRRLREARKRLVPRMGEVKPHHHNYPLTGVPDHLHALGEAGFTDVEVPWRAYVTCLFTARRAG
ncbi:MAG TPA: class I SAM-dependent methyltransferase [Micromonosporaceae bacterium]